MGKRFWLHLVLAFLLAMSVIGCTSAPDTDTITNPGPGDPGTDPPPNDNGWKKYPAGNLPVTALSPDTFGWLWMHFGETLFPAKPDADPTKWRGGRGIQTDVASVNGDWVVSGANVTIEGRPAVSYIHSQFTEDGWLLSPRPDNYFTPPYVGLPEAFAMSSTGVFAKVGLGLTYFEGPDGLKVGWDLQAILEEEFVGGVSSGETFFIFARIINGQATRVWTQVGGSSHVFQVDGGRPRAWCAGPNSGEAFLSTHDGKLYIVTASGKTEIAGGEVFQSLFYGENRLLAVSLGGLTTKVFTLNAARWEKKTLVEIKNDEFLSCAVIGGTNYIGARSGNIFFKAN